MEGKESKIKRKRNQSVYVYNNIMQTIKINADMFKNPSIFLDSNLNGLFQKAIERREELLYEKLDNMMDKLALIVKK